MEVAADVIHDTCLIHFNCNSYDSVELLHNRARLNTLDSVSYDDCLEDKKEDYQNCVVMYRVTIVRNHMHTDMSSSYT